jgi:hypothetical protein
LSASSKKLFVLRRDARPSRGVKLSTLGTEQNAEVCLTNPHCVCQHCFKHRPEIARRGADYLEHVGGGGLLLKRFTQFVKQPRILNGDDGLGRKVLHQLDLFVRERAHFLAIQRNGANQFSFLEHRHHNKSAGPRDFDKGNNAIIFINVGLIRPKIGNVEDLLAVNSAR